MNTTTSAVVTDQALAIIYKMHRVQSSIDTVSARYYAATSKAEKSDAQMTLNMWHKDMDKLVAELLAATK